MQKIFRAAGLLASDIQEPHRAPSRDPRLRFSLTDGRHGRKRLRRALGLLRRQVREPERLIAFLHVPPRPEEESSKERPGIRWILRPVTTCTTDVHTERRSASLEVISITH